VPEFLPHALPGWQVARRYSVPASMVERATGRRVAGDWRGACAAARFEVRVDVDAVRRRYGAAVAGDLDEDLRHLVPDLVRWHLPREEVGGLGRVLPNLSVTLARYGPAPDAPALWVQTPNLRDHPLRPVLRFGPLPRDNDAVESERWDVAPYLWDARATGGLRRRLRGGGRAVRWAPVPDGYRTRWRATWAEHLDWDAVADGVRHLLDTEPPSSWTRTGTAMFVVQPPDYRSAMFAVWASRKSGLVDLLVSVRTIRVPCVVRLVPRMLSQRFPDAELLRAGRLTPSGLHPLVRAALFPDAPGEFRPDLPAVGTAVRVRCRGVWHRVGWRDGHADLPDHTTDEVRREHTLRALGGTSAACVTVLDAWRSPDRVRLPRRWRELRHHAMALVRGGDTGAVEDLLDRGVDPGGLRTRRRRGLLHLAVHLDAPGTDVTALVRRLLDAGLDVNAEDADGRTPLGTVLFDGGSATLVRTLLDAGADPTHHDQVRGSMLHAVRSVDAATILPWLLGAGLRIDQPDRFGWTPLRVQANNLAPPETLRATLAAGADRADLGRAHMFKRHRYLYEGL
jgi:hypothetical protein